MIRTTVWIWTNNTPGSRTWDRFVFIPWPHASL